MVCKSQVPVSERSSTATTAPSPRSTACSDRRRQGWGSSDVPDPSRAETKTSGGGGSTRPREGTVTFKFPQWVSDTGLAAGHSISGRPDTLVCGVGWTRGQLTSRFMVTGWDRTGSSPTSYRWWSRSRTRRRSAWVFPWWPLGTEGGSEDPVQMTSRPLVCTWCLTPPISSVSLRGRGHDAIEQVGSQGCGTVASQGCAVCPKWRIQPGHADPSAAPRTWQGVDYSQPRRTPSRGQCGWSWAGPPCPAGVTTRP